MSADHSDSPGPRAQDTQQPIRVLAAVLRRGEEVLLCRRPDHKRHGGLWEFPGGKVEADESLFEAARRELEEELHMRVTAVGRTLYVCADPGSPYVIEFVEVSADGEPMPTEHSEVRWLGFNAASTMPLAPADSAFVHTALRSG